MTVKPYSVTVLALLDDQLEEGSVFALCNIVLGALSETGVRALSIVVREGDEL